MEQTDSDDIQNPLGETRTMTKTVAMWLLVHYFAVTLLREIPFLFFYTPCYHMFLFALFVLFLFYVHILCSYHMLLFYMHIMCSYFVCTSRAHNYVHILCSYFVCTSRALVLIFYVHISGSYFIS